MSPNPFARLRADFLRAPLRKGAAVLTGFGSAVLFALLFVLLYLFADLMVTGGVIPGYAELAPGRKAEFAAEWDARPEEARKEAVKRVGGSDRVAAGSDVKPPLEAWEWEARWRAGVYDALKRRVGEAAAAAYLNESPPAAADPSAPPRLGVLPLVVRERKVMGWPLGFVAGWNGWMWKPGDTNDADPFYLAVLVILAFLLVFTRGVLLNVTAYCAASATLDAVTRLRRAVAMHTYRLGSLSVRAVGVAEPVRVFTEYVEAVREGFYAWLTAAFRYPVQVVLLTGLLVAINFWLAVSFLSLALLVWVVAGQVAAYFRREARLASARASGQLSALQESMAILRLVKTYQMDRFNQNRVERQLNEHSRANWRRSRGEAMSAPMLAAVAGVAAVALLYLAGRAVLAGEFSPAGLVVFGAGLASLVPPIDGWFAARARVRKARAASAAIFEFLDRKGDAGEAADAEFLGALAGRLEFRQITLQEPGSDRLLLDDVSFAVPAGTKVALIGTDPAATRALACLLPRFLDPTTGEIRFEDKNIRWVTHESLRAQVAVVLQDDLTFGDTVLNNIGCGDPSYTLPQIIEAAKLAHAHQFIERLPYGYETVIGPRGVSLRPGERFRVALARAILRDPSLLVIEEPADPMDHDTAALFDDTLARIGPGRTILFLARRLSTLRAADRVFAFRGGKLEASGRHDDLWENVDFYRRLPILADAPVAEPV